MEPQTFSPKQLDLAALAQAAATIEGCDALTRYPRLRAEASTGDTTAVVQWQAQGELRGPEAQVWLHLQVQTTLPLICQRCLQAVEQTLTVQRAFRFVADEATAAALDAQSEDDVLVQERNFDLHALIEDELLLALPLIARHQVCAQPLVVQVADAGFAAPGAPSPFAALSRSSSSAGTPAGPDGSPTDTVWRQS